MYSTNKIMIFLRRLSKTKSLRLSIRKWNFILLIHFPFSREKKNISRYFCFEKSNKKKINTARTQQQQQIKIEVVIHPATIMEIEEARQDWTSDSFSSFSHIWKVVDPLTNRPSDTITKQQQHIYPPFPELVLVVVVVESSTQRRYITSSQGMLRLFFFFFLEQ